MSSLTHIDRLPLERLFRMGGGDLLNFSHRSLAEFITETTRLDITSPKYGQGSKANRMRQLWALEDDATVAKVLSGLIAKVEAGRDQFGFDVDAKVLASSKEVLARLSSGLLSLEGLKAEVSPFDEPHIQKLIERMEESIERDPSFAVGSAKDLIEAVCRTVLRERGKPVEGTPEMPELTKAVLAELDLAPQKGPTGNKTADTTRRLLSNLGSITQGVAELRNLHGTGHGRDGKHEEINPRYAALAAGAAATFSRFVFGTHKAKPVDNGESPS